MTNTYQSLFDRVSGENEPVEDGEEEESRFDDSRITNGEVTIEERCGLEYDLMKLYLQKAKSTKKPIIVVSEKDEYEQIKISGELFSGNNFYLLMDRKRERVLDMVPIAYHLLETKEGNFYAKLLLHDECHQP
jgi:hypothetical protein